MLDRKYSKVRVDRELKLGSGAQMVVISATGVESTIDLAELAALDNIAAADLAKIDGITNGTAAAGKALVLGASGEIATITSATITTLTSGAIVGADNSLGITGQTQATTVNGGAVVIAGAASIAGATGDGGLVSVTGGASGSTDGAGGAVSQVGGAGSGTGNGGAASVTGGLAGATGAGGAVAVTGGAGGATSGLGGAVSVTGGAGTANNDNGGNVSLSGGAPHGTGASGLVRLQAKTVKTQAAPGTLTTTRALTSAEVLGGIVEATHGATGANVDIQLPTGTELKAAMGTVAAGDSIDLTIINISAAAADTYTLTVNTDITIVGQALIYGVHATVFGCGSATFRLRWTTGTTFVAYRIS